LPEQLINVMYEEADKDTHDAIEYINFVAVNSLSASLFWWEKNL
jgi:hypothetical protein